MVSSRPDPAQDLSAPVNIGCGALLPIRSTRFAAIFDYTHDALRGPERADNKMFAFNCIVLTTKEHWEFHGAAGRADIDARSMMVGSAGDGYSCRHYRGCEDGNLVVGLRDDAIDPDCRRLFLTQVVPAQALLVRLIGNLPHLLDDDSFDSAVFTLFDEASAISRRDSNIAAPKLRMQRAKRFIEMHAFESIGLSDVARELGLSPFTALRQFRSATGKTPYGYLLELRLARARELLERTEDSIASIAEKVAFKDLAHFSRFFKKCTGESPSLYRSSRQNGRRPSTGSVLRQAQDDNGLSC
ncbi:MAG TPA: AraC family transcriptional regulator [Candidatus Baltobacteraceae bacterium]